MCDLGITAENFNPRILYLGKGIRNYESKQFYHSNDNAEIKCILSGKCLYKINDILYPVEKGDVIICNPGFSHGRILAPGEEMIEFYSGIDNISVMNYSKNFLTDKNTNPILNLQKQKQEFFDSCNEILSVQEKNEPGSDLLLKSLMMKLIIFVLKSTLTPDDTKDEYHLDFESNDKTYIVNTIISYVNENYIKEISLYKISRNMYLSPVYISKIFKDETGDSPINYLIKLRLSKAIEHLKEDRLTIKALSKSVGYKDPYYFSKLFKKYYGCSPVSYRDKLNSNS
jgi:YesN/AraC family two-component response regulator